MPLSSHGPKNNGVAIFINMLTLKGEYRMKPPFLMRDMAVTQAFFAALLFLAIPLFNLLGPSHHKWSGILHGLCSTLTVIVACYTLHSLYPFLKSVKGAEARLELRLAWTNVLVLLSIILGNWLYIGYREPDGAQQWLLFHYPAGHFVVMEFKEFASLFPLPLGVAASVLLRRSRGAAIDVPLVNAAIAVLVTLMWMFLLFGFVFGLGLSKIAIV
jgi:hypothetical protein